MSKTTKEVCKGQGYHVNIISYGLTRTIESEILINTTPKEAWEKLIDMSSWNKWNSFIKDVKGEVKSGNKISIVVNTPNMSKKTFKPKVYEVIPESKISWGGKAIYIGFEGVRDFYIEKIDDFTIKFKQVEVFKGPIVLLMNNMLLKISKGYLNMNKEFKNLIEKVVE
ncbi:hypothetical protein CI105_09155 [Candidatus Izimaplasma bacterium ZiA1]|uniref:SRPBCC domain-containing protein n=1 Tax=Candidatus Izimoplasma sp. ZiA1 TaxID=2024899 RepID=UPI000BAA4E95|nr:hypothetical protein CI105_09155 [Candidatus Izimaplasma bacterium ZiA1]